MMKITEVKIRKIFVPDEREKVLAIVSITLDDVFMVHDIKVIQGVERVFAAMPNRVSLDGRRQDIVHPIATGFRKELEEKVLEGYYRALDLAQNEVGAK